MKKFLYILILLPLLLFASCFEDGKEIGEKDYDPEINVRKGVVLLSSGMDLTLGSTYIGESQTITFVIENVGKDYLYLTGDPVVEISGADASMYSITLQPSDTLSPFTYKSFDVVFTPSGSTGNKTAVLTIRSNDPRTEAFSVNLLGNATVVTEPDMDVQFGGTTIAVNGSRNLGSSDVSVTQNFVFTVNNNGNADLTFSDPVISGIDSGMFVLVGTPGSTISASGSATFSIDFTPASAGVKEAQISITNDDPDSNPYVFRITATGVDVPAPDIEVRQGTTLLPHAGSEPFDFGNINQGFTSTTVTFTINNIGTAELNSLATTLSGADASLFTVSAPLTNTLAAGGSTTFTMTFTPDSDGDKTATVEIANNTGTNPYTFTVTGTGVALPEINLRNDTPLDLLSGGSFNFGSVVAGAFSERTFTIQNTGAASLLLSATPRIAITGNNYFSVVDNPLASIDPGGNDTFTIRYNPLEEGILHTATVSIASNDINGGENPYTFIINGTATAFTAPRIDVVYNGSSISESTTIDLGGMGANAPLADAITSTFTIRNTGSAVLNIASLNITDTTNFEITASPAATVAAGGSTTFSIRFRPTTAGAKSTTVTVDSNLPDFVFTLTGTGMEPEMDLSQEGTPIPDGTGSFDFDEVNTGGGEKYITFTITNSGAAGVGNILYLTGTNKVNRVSGSADFSVYTQPSKTSIDPLGGTTTFVIRYTPSAIGSVSAVFEIESNDPDENPYTFEVTGEGVNAVISVRRSDNVTEVGVGGTHAFGNQKVNTTSAAALFYIRNTGTTVLNLLSSPRVIISGADAAYFSVATQPSATVASGGGSSFEIVFNPTNWAGVGNKSATVNIYSNASNIPLYTFTITGTGTTPDIRVNQGGTTDIADFTGSHDFGNVNYGSAGVVIEFRIYNDGDAPLILDGAPNVSISGPGAANFTVTQQPLVSSIAVGGYTTFRIMFSPTPALPLDTVRSATVTIENDDIDGTEDPYTFTITGTCIDNEAPVITVNYPGAGIYSNGAGILNFTASDNVDLVVNVQAQIDGAAFGNVTSGTTTIDSINGWGTAAVEGPITINFQAVDSASVPNTGTETRAIYKDIIAPTINISGPSVAYARTGVSVTYTVTYADTYFNSSTLAVGDITLNKTDSANGDIAVTGTGLTRTVTISNLSGDGTLGISIAAGTATDLAGNTAPAAGPGTTFIVDNTPPGVTISTGAGNPTNAAFTATFTFTEDVTGFADGDISVGNGSAGTITTVDARTYTALISPSGQGLVTVNVAAGVATDLAGNNNTAAAQLSRTYDSVSPGVAISSFATGPVKDPFTVTFTFTEDVTGFALVDIIVANGTAGNFSAVDAQTFTVEITPDASSTGTITVDVAADAAFDSANNGNTAATQFSITFDTEVPVVAITSPLSGAALTGGEPFEFTSTEGTTQAQINGAAWVNITYGARVDSLSGWSSVVEGGAITLNLQSTDTAGNIGSNSISSFTKNDTSAPYVTSVAVPAAGNYTTGQALVFTVYFNEGITVSGTNSYLEVVVEAITRQAAYVSKTSNSITYSWTITGGIIDTNGTPVGALMLNGDTVQDSSNNNANLTLNNVGDTSNIRVNWF